MSSGVQRKGANFDPKVKLGKMKTKVCNVFFLPSNSSFIKGARAPIFELHEGSLSCFVRFQRESFISNIE